MLSFFESRPPVTRVAGFLSQRRPAPGSMHICLDFRPALRQGTGVGTYIHNLVLALGREFPADTYTAFSASWKHRLNGLAAASPVTVSDWKIPVRALDWAWHRWRWPPIEGLVGAVDVAHSPSPMLLPARRAKTVISIFDCHFLRCPDDVFGPVRRDYVPLARRSAQLADAIAVGSRSAADEVQELLGVPPEKIEITPLGVHERFFSAVPAGANLLEAHGLDAPFLLFAGRRERRKDLGTLLRAVQLLAAGGDPVRLALVGLDAPGWEETWAAAPEGARRLTRVIPHQPVEVLAGLYAAAAAVVMPSRWEGFGLPGLEAMAAGTPVVASRVGSLPEVLADAALFVPTGDPEALAEACRRVLADTELRERMRRRGRERAAEFRWSDTARRTHELYRRLTG